MFSKILVATDSLDACDAPSILAINLAKRENARLYFLHVLESSYAIYREWVKNFRTGEEITAGAEYIEAVKKTMAEKCAEALTGCKDYIIEARSGFPWMEILRMARTAKADLIVLGPHRGRAEEKGVLRRMNTAGTLGTTAEAVIMRAHRPVMIVGRMVPKEKLAFKSILFCTDFSETCQYAFELSLEVAQRYGSKMYIFHVLKITPGYPQEQIERGITRSKEKIQATYGSQIKGVDYSFDVWEGVPSVEILKYARLNDIDLITVGSHVREQEKRWYVGSVVENVGLGSYCPVVTVTRPEALLKFEE